MNNIMIIDKTAKCVIYGDDTTLLFSCKCPPELTTNRKKTLLHLEERTTCSALKINTHKTEAVLFFAPRTKVYVSIKISSCVTKK